MLVNNNLKKNFKYKTDGLQLLSKIENDSIKTEVTTFTIPKDKYDEQVIAFRNDCAGTSNASLVL